MRFTILLVGALLVNILSAQTISNIKITSYSDSVLVKFDLEYGINESVSLELYGSHDNFYKPLKEVIGDIGNNVMPGKEKSIWWYSKKEQIEIQTNISLTVKATRNVSPLNFITDLSGKKLKRGEVINIEWEGGLPSEKISVGLLKSGRLENRTSILNNGRYPLKIGRELKPGKYILFIETGTGEQNLESAEFTIKRKLPLGLIAIPVVGLGGIVLWLLQSKPIPEPVGPN